MLYSILVEILGNTTRFNILQLILRIKKSSVIELGKLKLSIENYSSYSLSIKETYLKSSTTLRVFIF